MESGHKEKWVFIVNPIAGNGFGKTMVPEIRQKIRKYQINGEVIMTEGPGHASELSGLYAEKGTRYIIAVGGDGTSNEVLNGCPVRVTNGLPERFHCRS